MERNLCIVPKVFAFRVPAAQSSGYRASDWSKDPIWSGRLRVVQVGDAVSVQLQHLDREGLFATCPVTDPRCVEQVTDSSRYFVLRLDDGRGRHAFLGIGFNNRDEAFEFKVALQDSGNKSQGQKRAEEYLDSLPSQDFSLPEDGMIRVNVNLKSKPKKDGAAPAASSSSSSSKASATGGGGGAFALPPPPKKGEARQAAAAASASGGGAGGGGGGAGRPAQQSQPGKPADDVLGLAETFGAASIGGSAEDDDPFAAFDAPHQARPAAPAAAPAPAPAAASKPKAKPAPAAAAPDDDWVAF